MTEEVDYIEIPHLQEILSYLPINPEDEEDIVSLFTEVLQEKNYHVMGFTNPLFILD